MPKIDIYQSRVGAAAPSPVSEQTGDAFGAVQARADQQSAKELGQFGKAVTGFGEYVLQEQERKETSTLASEFATFQDEQAEVLETKIREGTDDKLVDNFLTDYDAKASALGEKIQTQAGRDFYNKTLANHRSEFKKLAASGQAEVIGIKTKNEFANVLGRATSFVEKSPTSYESKKIDLDNALGNTRNYISGKDLEKLSVEAHQSLAKSAVRGLIHMGGKGPAMAQEQLLRGDWDVLTSNMKHALYREAHAFHNAKIVDLKLRETEQKKALEAKREAVETEYNQRINDPAVASKKGVLTAAEITQSILSPAQQRVYINIVKANAAQGNPKNPVLVNKLIEDIARPDGDPLKITDPNYPLKRVSDDGRTSDKMGRLPVEDAIRIQNLIKAQNTTEGRIEAQFVNRFKKAFHAQVKGDNTVDPEHAGERLYNFEFFVDQKVEEYKKQNKDIRDLFDKDKPDFLGKQVAQFMPEPLGIAKPKEIAELEAEEDELSSPLNLAITELQQNKEPLDAETQAFKDEHGLTDEQAREWAINKKEAFTEKDQAFMKQYNLTPKKFKALIEQRKRDGIR